MANKIPIKAITSAGAAVALSEFESSDTIQGIYLDAQAQNLYGLYSARPSASSVKTNTMYYASDTLECYRSTGTAWVLTNRGGAELGHGERTSPFTTTSTTFSDIPGLAVNYVAGEGAAFVTYGGTGKTTNSAIAGILALVVDGVQLTQMFYSSTAYLTSSVGCRISGKTPGATVNVRIQGRISGEGHTYDLFGHPTDRPFVHVVTG